MTYSCMALRGGGAGGMLFSLSESQDSYLLMELTLGQVGGVGVKC